jgi:hypothetical protein
MQEETALCVTLTTGDVVTDFRLLGSVVSCKQKRNPKRASLVY